MNCPLDVVELAEAYLLNRLPAPEAAAFEEHYLACPRCAEILEREQGLHDAIREAYGANARRTRKAAHAHGG